MMNSLTEAQREEVREIVREEIRRLGEELKRLPLLRNAMIEDRSTEKAERR